MLGLSTGTVLTRVEASVPKSDTRSGITNPWEASVHEVVLVPWDMRDIKMLFSRFTTGNTAAIGSFRMEKEIMMHMMSPPISGWK